MKKVFRIIGTLLVLLVVIAGLAYWWASSVAMSRYEKTWTAHDVEFPIPFPLSASEIEALKAERIAAGARASDPYAGLDMDSVTMARAIERGEHLTSSRLTCNGCHGDDFGGGTVIDVPIVAHWVAPNLTLGQGSVTKDYQASDWDHAVRHGLRRGGRSSSMPSSEFANLSDHELSDVVCYISSRPPVDRDMGKVRLGPVFAFMLASSPKDLYAFSVDHQKPHAIEPPSGEPLATGEHIVQTCRGCHGKNLSGGKMQGDPGMPIVANLTPHESGLKAWTEANFVHALRDGKRPDGTSISEYMPWKAYGRMSDEELRAVWAYLRTLPAVEKGVR